MHLVVFRCICNGFITACNLVQNGVELVQLMQKFVPQSRVGIFCNERTRSTLLVLNPCFGTCRTVWMLLGPFRCLTKLGSKRAEMVQLMQKFVPGSRVGIFRNERTRSTPLGPKLTFWCISYYSGAFSTVWLPYETRCKTG